MKKPNILVRMFVRNIQPVETAVRPNPQAPEIVITNRGFYIRDKVYYLNKILELSKTKDK